MFMLDVEENCDRYRYLDISWMMQAGYAVVCSGWSTLAKVVQKLMEMNWKEPLGAIISRLRDLLFLFNS